MRIDRRSALKWVIAAGVASGAFDSALADAGIVTGGAIGYGKDPDLMKRYQPGELWPLTLDDTQKRTARALCDLIIPADADSPSASSVAVPEFIDEWVSAPYPECARHRELITFGLDWLQVTAQRRFARPFEQLRMSDADEICAGLGSRSAVSSGAAKASAFFSRFRSLVAIGYYTTPAGMKALGYVGNVPSTTFDGPPSEVLERAGLKLDNPRGASPA
jgi:hypothetical protein